MTLRVREAPAKSVGLDPLNQKWHVLIPMYIQTWMAIKPSLVSLKLSLSLICLHELATYSNNSYKQHVIQVTSAQDYVIH